MKRCAKALGAGDVVVIAGGGVAGLALAAALASERRRRRRETDDDDKDDDDVDFRCVVLERDESSSARRQGYGVTLSETNGALRGLGVLDACREASTKSHAHWTFAPSGRALGYYGKGLFHADERMKGGGVKGKNGDLDSAGSGEECDDDRSGDQASSSASESAEEGQKLTNLRVPRGVVRDILLRSIPPEWIRWGATLKDFVEDSDGVDVILDNGDVIRATVLVGADGVRSGVRKASGAAADLKSGELRYLGVALCTGFTDLSHPLLSGQGFYTVDGTSRMFTMPFQAACAETGTPERSMWQLSVRVDEAEARALAGAPRSEVRKFVMKHTEGWHDPVAAMFEHTDWEQAWAGPLFDREEPPTSKADAKAKPHMALRSPKSRVVCIGDAAHPMSPFKGQGANTSLYDAWALAKWLTKAPPQTALACFYREMVARAFVKVRASREACEFFHNPDILNNQAPEFAGVDPTKIQLVLSTLNQRGVTAALAGDLESAVRDVVFELDAAEVIKPYEVKKKLLDDEQRSLTTCSESDVSEITQAMIDMAMEPPPPASATLSECVVRAVERALEKNDEPPLTDKERHMVRALRPQTAGRRPGNDYSSSAPIRLLMARGGTADVMDGREARFARRVADALDEQKLDRGDNVEDYFIRAKPIANGSLWLTSKSYDMGKTAIGLMQCGGCFKYYAVHGGGLRQHFQSGGDGPDCAAAAVDAMECENTEFESSSWRGSQGGKPKAWRPREGRKVLSPGMDAASRGDVEGMRRAIADEGWDPITDIDLFGSNALMWAAGGGFVRACDFLVNDVGMDVNATSRKDGRVPLHWAARNGALKVCAWLVDHGADPSRASYDGDFPFHLAIWKNHLDVAEWFAAHPGFDVNTTNRWGCNAVLWACTSEATSDETLRMVKWLCDDLGVSYSVVNVNGHSALHKCAIYGHGCVIDYFLTKISYEDRPKYIAPDDRNQAPSELARVNGFLELEEKLRHFEDKTMRLPVVVDE